MERNVIQREEQEARHIFLRWIFSIKRTFQLQTGGGRSTHHFSPFHHLLRVGRIKYAKVILDKTSWQKMILKYLVKEYSRRMSV